MMNVNDIKQYCLEKHKAVYTDFNCNEWNESMKYEYAEQATKVGRIGC
jgi:hypothetical protein